MNNSTWKEMQLEELIIRLESGTRPKGGVSRITKGIPSIGGEHITSSGSISFEKIKYVPEKFYKKMNRGKIRKNDVLIVKDGATTGKVAIVPEDFSIDAAVNEHVFILRTSQLILPRYLFYFLYSSEGKKRILANFVGSAQGGINTTFIKNCKVPVPPLSVQKKIVAILEKAEEIKEKRKKANELVNELPQSLFIQMFGNPNLNRKEFETKGFLDVFDVTTGKLNSNAAVEGGKYPFFTCSKETFSINNYSFDCEALLLAGNNAQGEYSVKYYNGKFDAYQRTYVLRLKKLNYQYRYFQFLLEQKLSELKKISIGTNTKYLTLGLMKNIKLIVPPSDSQRKFSEIMEKTELLKQKQSNSISEINNLTEVLMQQAFSGDLVT